MILVERTLGNIHDDKWSARLQGAQMDWVNLDQWEAQKTRIRKVSEQGTEVAMSLSRGVFLHDGDILIWNEVANTAIATRIQVREVMVIRLDGLAGTDPVLVMRTCVELGHALGNQHWPAVVKDGRVYVPLTIDRKVMASVMKTHAFQGIQYEFVPGSEVIPYLAPHESRLLFGGSEGPSHTHGHDHGHGHSHEHEHAHDHRH